MSVYAGSSPVEDWAGTFAQFVEPMPNQQLGVVRVRFMQTTLIVAE